ncbi:MAG: signal peptide peptidase SppA [Magnetococcales bacterium]|nr:signal peptide peptidase SppA [Magnetococcales bacterium]
MIQGLEKGRQAERQMLERLIEADLRERRKARWAKNLFRLFLALYLVSLLLVWAADRGRELDPVSHSGGHTALVEITGPIMPDGDFSADKVIEGLQKAFKDPDTKGVILLINSPGGSPVQAGQIHDEMLRLRKKHEKIPLYAVVEDLCASGGYYVAAAAQEILVDKGSLIGSIGVIMQGFGVKELLAEWGVESRTITAGRNKAFLDPFQDVKPEEKAHAQKLLTTIHEQFIAAVKQGRGPRLRLDQGTELFSGLIWTGQEAVALGLVDGLGSARSTAREIFKTEKLEEFTSKKDWMERFADRLSTTLAQSLAASIVPELR